MGLLVLPACGRTGKKTSSGSQSTLASPLVVATGRHGDQGSIKEVAAVSKPEYAARNPVDAPGASF
jgi:hypothetical protein